jgi:hypothetical protein
MILSYSGDMSDFKVHGINIRYNLGLSSKVATTTERWTRQGRCAFLFNDRHPASPHLSFIPTLFHLNHFLGFI